MWRLACLISEGEDRGVSGVVFLAVGSGGERTSGFMQVVGRILFLVVGGLRKSPIFLLAFGQDSGSFSARSTQPFLASALFLPLQSSERSRPFHPSDLPSLSSLTDCSVFLLICKGPCNYCRASQAENQGRKSLRHFYDSVNHLTPWSFSSYGKHLI